MRGILFANGQMNIPPNLASILGSDALIVAADGGMKNCERVGVSPKVIIGDLDSLALEQVSFYREKGIRIIQHPSRKDATDLELALQFIVGENIDDIAVLGALGSRWDMTLANILLIANPDFAGKNIRLWDGRQEIFLLKARKHSAFHAQVGSTLSLIPLFGDVLGVTTWGLEYPLDDETLHFGSTRGISNVIVDESAHVYYQEGLLLSVINCE